MQTRMRRLTASESGYVYGKGAGLCRCHKGQMHINIKAMG